MTSTVAPRPRWLSILDRISVAVCALSWLAAILHIAPQIAGAHVGPAIGLGLLAGYLLADLLSGMVHWLADRYFDPRTPILGPALIAPFREHHADALAMTRHDFFEVSGNNGLATIPLALAVWWLPSPTSFWAQSAAVTLIALGLSIIATNQLHCWAHAPDAPRLVRRLQAWRLILPPEHHAIHHRREHDRAYCVTSGWLNPLLDWASFFPRLERGIASVARTTDRTV